MESAGKLTGESLEEEQRADREVGTAQSDGVYILTPFVRSQDSRVCVVRLLVCL